MPMLTDLADVARNAGLTVREVPGWKTAGIYGGAPIQKVVGVTWHHTATPADRVKSRNNPTLQWVINGMGYPACHILVAWDGSVDIIAAGKAAHAGAGGPRGGVPQNMGNHYYIGIEVEGTTGLQWSEAQLESAAKLGAALDKAYGPNLDHHAHYEWTPGRKVDPSGIPGKIDALREAIKRGNWSAPAPRYMVSGVDENDPDGGLNIRTGPGGSYKKYGNPLKNGTPWYPTGRVKDGWVEGRTPWMRDNNKPPMFVSGHYLSKG